MIIFAFKKYCIGQSVQMLECFLKLAEGNTAKNLETCGVLAGLLVSTWCKILSEVGLFGQLI